MLGREWKWIGESRSGPDGMEKLQELTGGLFGTMVMGALGLVAFGRIVGGEGGGGRGGVRLLKLNAAFFALLVYDIVWQTGLAVKGCSWSLRYFWGGPAIGIVGSLLQVACIGSQRKAVLLVGALVLALVYSYGVVALIVVPFNWGDEYSPIMFDLMKVEYMGNANTTWLSRDGKPGGIAKEWGAGCTRVATQGTFRVVEGGGGFNFINTHLDHVGDMARNGGGKTRSGRGGGR
jgi:hypothetical protein